MKLKTQLIAIVAIVTICVSGCQKDVELCATPTLPTSFNIEDGAIIEDTIVRLSASGSTVEKRRLEIKYEYFIGTSSENLSTTGQEVVLEPYTQYFWSVKASTLEGEGEMSEVRTFYCVPPMREIETDNGDGDWAAVLRWKNIKLINVKISATSDPEGFSIDEFSIPEGQDSCYIKYENYSSTKNNAYTHWWDDLKGIYYEPIIYNFTLSAEIKVGDKVFPISIKNIKEIILDKRSCVRDHEYNVYRLTKIGDLIWMADDYRATTYIDYENGNEVKKLTMVETSIITGEKGILYYTGFCENMTLIKGFRFPTYDDWEKTIGIYSDDETAFQMMRSQAGWRHYKVLEELGNGFNAKPFGFASYNEGFLKIYNQETDEDDMAYYYCPKRRTTSAGFKDFVEYGERELICKYLYDDVVYLSFRFVKDKK